MYITAAEDALFKTAQHRTKLHLSIYQPPTVLAAQVDGSHSKGDQTITYDNVTEGSHLAVESGMTMYVGTTAGAADLGTIRVKSATATTVVVPENSHINWDDDLYLTIVRFWEIQPIYPRIIQDPADEANTLWYKDYDIEYTDQNDILGTFICMGPHHAAFIDDGAAQVYYTSTGTQNLRNQAMTYDWHFQGGTPTGSSAAVPGWVSYSTPGHYTTKLRVTTGDGCDDVSYRHISIYDRPSAGTDIPFLNWEMETLSGDIQQAGYTGRIRIRDSLDRSVIRDGALVVIFADDWFGGTKQSIGGNQENRQTIVFVGYIQVGTIQWNWRDGYVVFDVGSPTETMKNKEGFAVSVQSSSDPSADAASDENIPSGWVAVLNMTVNRAIYHYLRWHSTALFCNDYQFTVTDQQIQFFDANRDSLFAAISNIMDGALLSTFACDRQGKMWASADMASVDNALSIEGPAGTQTFLINNENWMGDPLIDERQIPAVSYLELGGVAYYGPASGTFQAFMSAAPGSAPGYGGRVQRIQGLALSSQATLNTLSGNVFAFKNARYPSISFDMIGNYRNLDIAPQRILEVDLAASDTPRGITFSNKKFSPFSINWMYDAEKEFMHPTVSVREVTEGFDGDTIAIPDVPPTEPESGGDIDVPPITVPPIPPSVLPPVIANSEYIIAQFDAVDVTADVPEQLTICNFRSNVVGVTASSTTVSDISENGNVWMMSIYVYAINYTSPYTAFTLSVLMLPCPGMILDSDFYTGVYHGGDYTRLVRDSYVGFGSRQNAYISVSFPVFTRTDIPQSICSIIVTADVTDVRIAASMCATRLGASLQPTPDANVCEQP